MYLFLDASWKIPAIYTIGKVLDFAFVETTSILYHKRTSTMAIWKFYY